MLRKLIPLALSALIAGSAGASETFTIDPVHSSVVFKIRHLVAKVTGRFDDFGGTIVVNRDDLTRSSVQFAIRATSIDTDNTDRDNHLRSEDFFAVEKYPEITFKSTGIAKAGEDKYDVTGDFTMRGKTKRITIPVEILGFAPGSNGGRVAGFETAFKINRKDYDIIWNKALDAGGFVLGDEVDVAINLEAGSK